jgi:hypothetical protein
VIGDWSLVFLSSDKEKSGIQAIAEGVKQKNNLPYFRFPKTSDLGRSEF